MGLCALYQRRASQNRRLVPFDFRLEGHTIALGSGTMRRRLGWLWLPLVESRRYEGNIFVRHSTTVVTPRLPGVDPEVVAPTAEQTPTRPRNPGVTVIEPDEEVLKESVEEVARVEGVEPDALDSVVEEPVVETPVDPSPTRSDDRSIPDSVGDPATTTENVVGSVLEGSVVGEERKEPPVEPASLPTPELPFFLRSTSTTTTQSSSLWQRWTAWWSRVWSF